MNDDLTTLLRDAVETVQPTDRRRQLRDAVEVATRRRHRRYAIGGGLVAAALVITGVTINAAQSSDPEPQPIGPSTAKDPNRGRPVYAVYYIGDTPQGPRLFRELRQGSSTEYDVAEAVDLVGSAPSDPDYETAWSAGQLLDASVGDGVINVEVDASLTRPVDGHPASDLLLQQVVYTAQAAVGQRLPVQFMSNGRPAAEVDGLPTRGPVANDPQLDVLALVSIDKPSERQTVADELSASGLASSFEGTVPWELRDASGTVVMSGVAQAIGYVDRLYPWVTGTIHLGDLAPGEYTFVAMTDDPSGGEGPGPTTDTRTIIVR